jgi:hypothetical protein
MIFLRIAVIALLASLSMPAAHAGEPTLDEKARYLLQGVDAGLDSAAMFKQMTSTLKSTFPAMPPEAIDRMTTIFRAEYDKMFADRMALYADVYKAVYTPDEIDRMYAFYTTPEGAAIIAKNAAISKEISAAVRDRAGLFYKNAINAVLSDPEFKALVGKPPKNL